MNASKQSLLRNNFELLNSNEMLIPSTKVSNLNWTESDLSNFHLVVFKGLAQHKGSPRRCNPNVKGSNLGTSENCSDKSLGECQNVLLKSGTKKWST